MLLNPTSWVDFATNIAGATAVFHQFKLDFCCGGQQSLGEAIAKRGIDQQAVLAALAKLQKHAIPETDWRNEPTTKLINHILQSVIIKNIASNYQNSFV
ncbi:DUF542 domain-containing protein [Alishewanella longhuensis]